MQLERYSRFVRSFFGFSKGRTLLAFLLVFLGGLVEGIGIVLLIPFADLILGGADAGSGRHALLDRIAMGLSGFAPDTRILLMVASFAGLVCLRAVVIYLRDMQLFDIGRLYMDHLRARLFSALGSATWSRVVDLGHTEVEHVLNVDTPRINAGVSHLVRITVSLILVTAQIVIAFWLSPGLTAIVCAVAVLGAALSYPAQRSALAVGSDITQTSQAATGLVSHFLDGIKAAKVYGFEQRFLARYLASLAAARDRLRQFLRSQVIIRIGLQSTVALVSAALLYVGLVVLDIPLMVMAVLMILFSRISGPLIGVQQGLQSIGTTIPAFEAVTDLTDRLRAGDGRGNDGAPQGNDADLPPGVLVRATDIRFGYGSGAAHQEILRGVSLSLRESEVVALSGASGSGKTTLLDVLCGLLTPTAGQISRAGLRDAYAPDPDWRVRLAYVGQDSALYADSVRANLTWAAPSHDDASLWEALDRAAAGDLVRGLDGGLEAAVGERGRLLSGGERQRIALAAALLRRPRLLILDEATNALDTATERRALEGIIAGVRPGSVLLVTHRETGLALCDRVLELDALQNPPG